MELNAQEEIKAQLMQNNDGFRRLMDQHHEYSRLVSQYEAKPVLSQEEEVEEHRLKKLKLHVKDQIEAMLGQYRAEHVS